MAKKFKYEEWHLETNEPSKLVYIITGESHWKREYLNALKKHFNCDYEIINEKFDKVEKKLKYRNLRYKKHLLMFEPIGKINNVDLERLIEYCKMPSKHAVVIIGINDWRIKKLINSRFKNLRNSKHIGYFDLDYPSKSFLTKYTKSLIDDLKLTFETPAVKKKLIDKVTGKPSEIRDNLEMLANFGKIISDDMVKDLIEDYTNMTYQQLINSVVELNRKKIPFMAYSDLINSDKKDITIMINIRKHVQLLYQAKYLKLKGILRNNDIIEKKKPIYDVGEIQFREPNIWNEPDYKINMLLEQSDKVSLKEIIRMLYILDNNIVFRDEADKDSKRGLDNYNIKIQSNKALLELLNRRNPIEDVLDSDEEKEIEVTQTSVNDTKDVILTVEQSKKALEIKEFLATKQKEEKKKKKVSNKKKEDKDIAELIAAKKNKERLLARAAENEIDFGNGVKINLEDL